MVRPARAGDAEVCPKRVAVTPRLLEDRQCRVAVVPALVGRGKPVEDESSFRVEEPSDLLVGIVEKGNDAVSVHTPSPAGYGGGPGEESVGVAEAAQVQAVHEQHLVPSLAMIHELAIVRPGMIAPMLPVLRGVHAVVVKGAQVLLGVGGACRPEARADLPPS